MFRIISTVALSAAIGLGALAAMPAAAQAQGAGIYLGVGSGHHGPVVDVQYRDHHRRHHRRPMHRARDCTPREALYKAARMGLRNARVVGTGARTIRVAGVVRGYRDHVTFARAPNCPVLR